MTENTHQDPLIPPEDALSNALYKSSKLDHLFPIHNSDSPTPTATTTIAKSAISTDLGPSPYQPQWKLLRTLAGAHQGWIQAVAIDETTNNWFATGSQDATIKIWNLQNNQIRATLTGHIMGVRTLAISRRFPYLFSGSEDKTMRCWDLERSHDASGCQIRNFHGHVGGVYALALHDAVDVVLSGGRDAVVRVWDIRTSKEVALLTGHTNDITSIIADASEPQVVTSSMDGTIKLWDLRNSKCITTITQHPKSIRDMKAHPLEYTFVSGDSGGGIKQWVLPKAELLENFERDEHASGSKVINTLSINPVTNTLFAGYDDGKMDFYNYTSGKLIQSGYTRHLPGSEGAAIYASTFDMSGLRLITCEGDKSIKIWGDDDGANE
ncbi:uncharacterized protein LODBEIA_P21680 [Lodderomyces beijingensis]|uniref:Pre-mRNA-splicing factor PRP46 n=1 Tax=Lodderomyces beijingensis TaxID=1775926 RepID=A0ABP0ZIF7_9ASCO